MFEKKTNNILPNDLKYVTPEIRKILQYYKGKGTQ